VKNEKMKFGLCARIEYYQDLCDIGYDFIELPATEIYSTSNSELRNLKKKIDERNIPCVGFNSYCDESLSIVGDEFSSIKTLEYAKRVCEKAALLGVQNIGIGAPLARKLPKYYDLKKADEQAREFLTITAEEAYKYRINILFESLCTKLCDYMVCTSDALTMVEQLGIPNLQMVLDFYHMSMMGENITRISDVMPYVRHLHISGFDQMGNRTYLFENQLDYFRTAIHSAYNCGYNRTISIEGFTQNFHEDAQRSLSILNQCCK